MASVICLLAAPYFTKRDLVMSYARALAFAPVMLAATFVTSYAENSSIGAQAEDIGMREYVNNCAVCHGDFGKGDGPLVPWLRQAIPDLTTIQKRSDGVFPFERIYGIVDGREEIGSHGRRDMPVWGKSFSRQMDGYYPQTLAPKQLQSFVRGRILALVGYIYSLQEK